MSAKLPKPAILVTTILLSLLLLVGIFFKKSKPTSVSTNASPVIVEETPAKIRLSTTPNNCEDLKIDIRSHLNKAAVCKTDADCINLDLTFPFECYQLGNKSFDLSIINAKIEQYDSECPLEEIFDCPNPPIKEEIICASGYCSDTRWINN